MRQAGYPTSPNRVSQGVAFTPERHRRVRLLAEIARLSVAEQIGRLIDAEWERREGRTDQPFDGQSQREAIPA